MQRLLKREKAFYGLLSPVSMMFHTIPSNTNADTF